MSLGEQVNAQKEPWIDQAPYFVKPGGLHDLTIFCPESAKVYADRVVEKVPIVSEMVSCMAMASTPSDAATEPIAGKLRCLYHKGSHR